MSQTESSRWNRRRLLTWVLILAGVGLVWLPFLLWLRSPSRSLRVVIVDKTVSTVTRREHAGLIWVLDHLKVRQPDGTHYRKDEDYYGFFPGPNFTWTVREPSIAAARPELIYLADTYGVYTEEFFGKAYGNRSSIIYGGLRAEEAQDIDAALPGCLTLVGEFNTFADPTGGAARRECMKWFGLTWNGWIGRFFQSLRPGLDVPPWAVANYERQYGKSWDFKAAGFLLVNQKDQVVVLEEGVDAIPERGLQLHGLPAGRKRLDLPKDARYDYWFDVVSPAPGTEILAAFELPLLPSGQEKLRAFGIPSWTPAVLESRQGTRTSYYFAGDFVDTWPVPGSHRLKGLVDVSSFLSHESPGNSRSFFWKVYAPMMRRIIEDTLARKAAATPPAPAPANSRPAR